MLALRSTALQTVCLRAPFYARYALSRRCFSSVLASPLRTRSFSTAAPNASPVSGTPANEGDKAPEPANPAHHSPHLEEAPPVPLTTAAGAASVDASATVSGAASAVPPFVAVHTGKLWFENVYRKHRTALHFTHTHPLVVM